MGQIARLGDIIARLSEFGAEDVIYASEPWTEGSDAIVLPDREEDDGMPHPDATTAGLTYFLEIDLAMEFIEDWVNSVSDEPSSSAVCERLIQYAVNDA
jgi:hypothetical protein